MKKLLIVESPAKIKTISKFLDNDTKVMSTVGHIKDLPQKKLGIHLTNPIEFDYEVLEDKAKVIADICKEASRCDEIYLAPDPDREGEIIAWHIGQDIEKVAKKSAKIHRITFNEITKKAVLEAIAHPSVVDIKKVAAQQARRALDRWVGYEVSPVLWQKIKKGLSAGRVQSVALRLIADREEAIRAFKPEEYWSIEATFNNKKDSFKAELAHINKKPAVIKNTEEATKLVEKIKATDFTIESITDKKRTKNPYPPFMTSTLQQAAFNKLGFSVKKTMQIAQKLYEGIPLQDPSTPVALITYMRSDSMRIADSALKEVRSYIKDHYDASYLPAKGNVYVKDAGQDAHEAIRPIEVSLSPEKISRFLSADEAKLYKLIWQRFVSCQMASAEYAQRQVAVTGDNLLFRVTGSTLIFDGFLKVYSSEEEEKEQKVQIPASLEEGQALSTQEIKPEQHFTQAPPRFSEATLVKELEKEGIGRPSTYATILSTIQARAYTSLDTKKRFVPTELGMAVTKLLVQNMPTIMDIKFTAHMEEDLDKIAQGDMERDKLLNEFYKGFTDELTKFRGTAKGKREPELTTVVCPECKEHKLAIRFGSKGEFLGCTGYPTCSFTSNFERSEDGTIKLVEAAAPKVLDELCPKCGKNLREVRGKFGMFIACSGYPDCSYIQQNKANFPCPKDGGDVVQRSWRGGKFWGCSNYPKCKFAVFSDIVQEQCPQCKQSPYLIKKVLKKGTTISCPSGCGYKVVQEVE